MAYVALFHVSPEFKRPSERLVLEDNLLHVVMFSLLAQLCCDWNDTLDFRSSTVLYS